MSQLPFDTRVRVAAALVDGVSIRATERLLGVHRDSIMKVGLTAGEACARLHDARCLLQIEALAVHHQPRETLLAQAVEEIR